MLISLYTVPLDTVELASNCIQQLKQKLKLKHNQIFGFNIYLPGLYFKCEENLLRVTNCKDVDIFILISKPDHADLDY